MTRLGRLTMGVALLFLVSQAAWASTVRVTAERVNLRANSNTGSPIVGTVIKGTVLEVGGREGDWIRVAAPSGGAAYIHSAVCELAPGAVASAPAPVAQAVPVAQPARPAAPAARPAVPAPPAAPAAYQAIPAPPAPPALPAMPSAPAVPEIAGSGWSDEGMHFGPTLTVGFFGDFGVGGRLSVGLSEGPGFGALATADYLFGAGLMQAPEISLSSGGSTASSDSSGSGIMVDGYATYRFDAGSVKPYVGAGVSYYRFSSSYTITTNSPYDTGPNDGIGQSGSSFAVSTIGGVRYGRFFADVRYRFGMWSAGMMSAGISF